MPKPRKAPPAASAPPAADGDSTATPAPPAALHITPWTLPAEQVLHRVHQDLYKADQFNPGQKGNARFSPIRDAKGDLIPTLYAAVDSRLWPAASLSVQAHLIKLVRDGRVVADPAPTLDARYALG